MWKIYEGDEIPKFMYMTPPALHQGEYAETLSVVVPMTWDVVAQWADTRVGHRPPAYTAFKEALADKVLTQLANVIPNIREAIERMDTATPLTIRDYTGVGHGAMCGERKDCRSTFQFMPVMTHVPNLFMTGQSVLMHGFCGVTLTAIQTCEAILGEQTIVNKMNRKP